MARLAEMSVAIALRDWQWIHRNAHDQFPDRYLALAGNAEKKLGDALIQHDERIFIFELKSTDRSIADEWRLVTDKNDNTQEKKSAHRWAKKLIGRLTGSPSAKLESDPILIRSLQAHHFLYWSPRITPGLSASGHLILEPYLFGTMRRNKELSWHLFSNRCERILTLASQLPSQLGDHPSSIRYRAEKVLPLDILDGRFGRLIEKNDLRSGVSSWRYLGLPFEEFQNYVNDLCGGSDENEPINVIVLSDQGSFFAHITSTDQLRTIFDPPSQDTRVQNELVRGPNNDEGALAMPEDQNRFSPNAP